MTDRPIPFSDPMIDAILARRKTQTRRIPKPDIAAMFDQAGDAILTRFPNQRGTGWEIGDRLWVRESYYQRGHWEPLGGALTRGGRQKWAFVADAPEICFDAPPIYRKSRHPDDPDTKAWHKRLGRFMPRAASRSTLVVTDVRVQRLQDISEEDAKAEGVEAPTDERDEHDWKICPKCGGTGLHGALGEHLGYMEIDCTDCDTHRKRFQHLWNCIHGPDAWAENPWVCAVSFSVHHANIDSLPVAA